MGRYIDWADVTGHYPSVAKDKGAELGAKYIEMAEGEVDARLAPKYTVPFVPGSSNAPPVVRSLSIDLAYYRMTWQQKGSDVLKEYIDERFRALVEGDMMLVNSSGVIDPANVGGAWASTEHRTSFGIDPPEGWSTSAEWQRDQEDERTGD